MRCQVGKQRALADASITQQHERAIEAPVIGIDQGPQPAQLG
jgi:hypothetical protein